MEEVTINNITATKEALALVWDVFLKFEAPCYSEEGINEFHKTIHDEEYLSELTMYGAYIEDKLIGVIATRNNNSHIALFFVDDNYHHKGVGKKLFEASKADCHNEIMTVNSSPYAVEIYSRLGFVKTDDEQVVSGIRFTPMKLILPK